MADNFRDAASKYEIRSTLVIGASFGIFLTFGQAWADFLKETIALCIPQNQESEFVKSLIYALGATGICLLAILLLICCDKKCKKIHDTSKEVFRKRSHKYIVEVSKNGKTKKKTIIR